MGSWLYGCDVCQNVCPLNKGQWDPVSSEPYLDEIAQHLSPRSVLGMKEEFFHRVVYPQFFYHDDFVRWQVNALRAVGNSRDQGAEPLVRKHFSSSDERLRTMAAWAAECLLQP